MIVSQVPYENKTFRTKCEKKSRHSSGTNGGFFERLKLRFGLLDSFTQTAKSAGGFLPNAPVGIVFKRADGSVERVEVC